MAASNRERGPRLRRGFTLVEIMVAIVIIGLVTAVTIPAFSRFNSRQVLVQEIKTLETSLRAVQGQSVSSLKGLLWGVRFRNGSISYWIFGTRDSYSTRVESKQVNLSSGVVTASVVLL